MNNNQIKELCNSRVSLAGWSSNSCPFFSFPLSILSFLRGAVSFVCANGDSLFVTDSAGCVMLTREHHADSRHTTRWKPKATPCILVNVYSTIYHHPYEPAGRDGWDCLAIGLCKTTSPVEHERLLIYGCMYYIHAHGRLEDQSSCACNNIPLKKKSIDVIPRFFTDPEKKKNVI